ncbi:MAG: hypothetical protein JWL77_6465 [Chthonomonadaceae bacterium]|nr:hypothetical protein [Chthonomonadaceae bacterium]
MTAVSDLEERLTRLEKEVEALKREHTGVVSDKTPWWEQISGVFKGSSEFEEAVRLGREWRESQRMEYDEGDTEVTEDANG